MTTNRIATGLLILGAILMAGKIYADGEPGGIPVLLVLISAGWIGIQGALPWLRKSKTYRFAVGLAALASFLTVWVNLAVGIIGEPEDLANLMYIAVPLLGIIGAFIACFRPRGTSLALFITAGAQALVTVITTGGDLGAPTTPIASLLGFNAILIALWLGSGLLFRKAIPR